MFRNTTPPRSSSLGRLARLSMLALACIGLSCAEEEKEPPCLIGNAGCPCLSMGLCNFQLTCQPSFNKPGTMVCRPPGASASDPDGGFRSSAAVR